MVSYIDLVKPVYLTKDFLEQYKNKKAPFGQLGLIVYLRTYSRFIPELNRREYWWETVLRVVEYSMSLVPKRPRVPFAEEDLRKEAESLFDMIFNMRGFPSGRTLFVGGSKAAELNPSANFNCSFCTVNSLKSFTDAMYLLLLGCGVGYSIEEQYVSQLPKFNTQVELDVDRPIFPLWRESDKSHEDTVVDYNEHGDIFIDVGDSKQGWTDALKYFLEYFTDFDPAKGKSIIINYDYIRPEGTRLKTFGGRASGYKPLKIMFEEIAARIKATDGTIDPTTAMDIMNSIAKAIVVGGVRRSSQIAFGDVSDNKFRDAKKDLWTDPDKEQYRTTRVLSNNSVHLWEKPSYEKLQEIFATIKTNGEPGLSIAQNAAKRRPNYRGSNPCHEILLDHQGVCNLTTLNLAAFVVDGEWDYTNLLSSMRLITRMGSRITLVDMWDSEWDYVQKRDRLLGVSLTGIVEAYNSLNPEYQEGFHGTLQVLRSIARSEADLYHDQLGIQRSLLVTTVKPEGTISQLPTVSSGVHAPYAPYYKRRIRVSVTDPIAKALRDLDLKPVPENGQGDNLYAPECNTWVFEFPVKTQATIRAIDEPAIAQLERYKMLMSFYAEHTVSVTITVAEHEWNDVCKWVYDNWDYCIGIAFLPRFDPSDLETPYPNMPYEATTEDQYYNLEINEDELIKLISFYETEYEDYDLDASCGVGKGSACPIR